MIEKNAGQRAAPAFQHPNQSLLREVRLNHRLREISHANAIERAAEQQVDVIYSK